MLDSNFGFSFFLKSSKNDIRYIYLRIIVDEIPMETSTKRKWDIKRWDQKSERALGNKEDAKTLNFFLDAQALKLNKYVNQLISDNTHITTLSLMDYMKGNDKAKAKVIEEFQKHNSELEALVDNKEYAQGTLDKYITACSHVQQFIKLKYKVDDLDFRELDYEFISEYELFLKIVRKCNNNTTLKYISNFKKIVLRAIAKKILPDDPFIQFKRKKTRPNKKPLTAEELKLIEDKQFSSARLTVVKDTFIFQCYTGLAYIDVRQLKKAQIKKGMDGNLWIMSDREKTDASTNIPLLPKALEIIEKYKNDPICIKRGTVLPVRSNQKMNEYLKEIAELCGVNVVLNTHKARRTFGSTVTLKNGVPLHIVKEMLGHHSVKQTEEYAITEEQSIAEEMSKLKERLISNSSSEASFEKLLHEFSKLITQINEYKISNVNDVDSAKKSQINQIQDELKKLQIAN
ncbi:recombinase [Elizabethkingia miricola]|uniref:site-specific integrase n=1 Tax=Elizabethkingia miricola TaxID=172045 RepID=UPI0009999335|nr:site-specific integrase [Elizabethkingia miricola]OPB86627.1 recombinase [Elizabethkingia miricola]